MIPFGEEWVTHLVIGEVLRWHVREDMMMTIEGKNYIDPAKLQPVGRLGGPQILPHAGYLRDAGPLHPARQVHPQRPRAERRRSGESGFLRAENLPLARSFSGLVSSRERLGKSIPRL